MLAKRKNAVRKRLLVATGVWIVAILGAALLAGQVQAERTPFGCWLRCMRKTSCPQPAWTAL
jgi:hypothetical protein